MKLRIEGRIVGSMYEVVQPDGSVISQMPLDIARKDAKLAAAIKRNGWQAIPEA